MKERREGGKGGAGDHMAARGGETFLSNVVQDKARLQDQLSAISGTGER